LSEMPPGPTEPTSAQLQNLLKIVVDDLIKLYGRQNFVTSLSPNLEIITSGLKLPFHPAMCKLCGFADHSHNDAPCTKCKVTRESMFPSHSLRNKFAARTGEEHRQLCFQYRVLPNQEEKDKFFSTHGVRWTEFARLKYFDLVRYTIIDPMHNLLLGKCIAKTQGYTRWIKTNALRADTPKMEQELHSIHDFLESYKSPQWAGRLPMRVGEPAGGSLTADKYKCAVTGPWAIIIPVVWDRLCKDATAAHQRALDRYEA
ncbi:hypothetical protein DFH07DRAFT_732070, partial [Mycena maculata]